VVFTKTVAILGDVGLDAAREDRMMDQRSIERHLRRWHRRDKNAGEDLTRNSGDEPSPGDRKLSARTGSGLSIEDQVRKEWDPSRGGGLPVFFYLASDDN
jgi:hypothetical protein